MELEDGVDGFYGYVGMMTNRSRRFRLPDIWKEILIALCYFASSKQQVLVHSNLFAGSIMCDKESECYSDSQNERKEQKTIRSVRDAILKELGVSAEDMSSFKSFTKLLHSPRDPSGLALIRMLYGILMMMDAVHERGLSSADSRWGDPMECRFPLFNFLRPPPLQWMILIYVIMITGAAGIALGFHYRKSCLCFLVPYWYIFLLDKSHWNNHSYLFGLIGTQLLLSGANRCWSLDGKHNPEFRHKDVPLWNYALLRGQIFLVYFIAGLKKTNLDWIGGYSMEKLGYHWVFDGFRLFLDGDQITFLVVHLGGFLLDLTVGFFMLMEFSRPYAFLFCGLFNLMNSRMFAIGMFPYVMIAVMPIFCSADWPKKVLMHLPGRVRSLFASPPGRSDDCIYDDKQEAKTSRGISGVRFRHQVTALAFCCYFCLQGFLPYSHSLTPGYNTWTQGLYGYSWDMMVHHWRHVHTTITVVDKKTGGQFHLDPEAWTRSRRWSHHADMVKQFAHCLHERMSDSHGLKDVEIYMDIWISLNRRFTQRMYDPSVDILHAKWSPFEEVTWVLPLQTELTRWRRTLVETEQKIFDQWEHADVLFVTDFPGFHLLNYVGETHQNTTLEVMKGSVEIQFEPDEAIQLDEGQVVPIPSGSYHRVSPLKHSPACYMYVYFYNNTELASTSKTSDSFMRAASCPADATHKQQVQLQNENRLPCRGICWHQVKKDLLKKVGLVTRSMTLIGRALFSIVSQNPMIVKKEEFQQEDI